MNPSFVKIDLGNAVLYFGDKLISVIFLPSIPSYEVPYTDLHAVALSISEIRLKSTQGRLYVSYESQCNNI